MPYKRKNGARTKRKPIAKGRRRAGKTKRSTQGLVPGLPLQRRAYLRYCENHTITSTTGALSSIVFRANGCYDPDFTGGGHQPMGFDQWTALYNHYTVVSAKLTATFVDAASGTPLSSAFGVYLSDDTAPTGYTTAVQFIESKRGSWHMSALRNSKAGTVKEFYSAKKFFNISDVKDNHDRLGSNVGTVPAEQAAFHVWYQTLDGSTIVAECMITIDYIVEFNEPKNLPQS